MYPLTRPRRRLYGTFVVALLLAAIAAGGWTAPTATGQVPPPESGIRPANPQSQCAGRYEVWVEGRLHGCSHGYDPHPEGVDRARDPIRNPRDGVTSPSTPGATPSGTTTAAAGNSTVCVGDGNSGPRVQAVYVFAAGADNSATVVPSIKAWAGDVDAVFNTSAAATGGTRHVRYVTDSSCQVVVNTAAVTTTQLNSFDLMIGALEAQGFNRLDRKYMVWADTTSAGICGIGELWSDDQPGLSNLNTRGDMFARADRSCWGLANSVEAHELMHNLGGVQETAPHATTLNHCTDNYDRMCYTDGSGYTVTTVCASSALENQFDCNHDDYYYAGAPPAANYLATHWNAAASPYLEPLQPPPTGSTTFSVGSSSVAAGQAINVTWGGVNPATPYDWIGLYPSSATADNDTAARIAFQFTNGAASGTVAFVVPATTPPGNTYEFRHFWNNSYYRMGKAGPITVQPAAPPTLSATPNTLNSGQSLNVTWSGIVSPTGYDWIGLYPQGVADTSPNRTTFRFTNGMAAGTLPLMVPAAAATGLYDLRLFSNNSFTKLATFGLINIQGPPPPTVSGSPNPVNAGSTLNATWSGISSPMTYDWIGLYPQGATDSSSARVWFFFTNAMTSGTMPMMVPAGTAPGPYELRLFANNSYTKLATSPLTVLPAPPAAVSGSPTAIPAGQSLTASWANIASPTTYDWVGLYPPGATDNSPARVWFFFTNAMASGTKSMMVPASAAGGTYELRLFANNSYTRLATSTLTIQPAPAPSVSGTPNPVTKGQNVNVSWANIASPTTYDWVGLYPPGANDSSAARVWFFFTNAMASGTKSMTVPAGVAAGTYELRLFANNSYTKLATSPITVQ